MEIEQLKMGIPKGCKVITKAKRCIHCGKILQNRGRPNESGLCSICTSYAHCPRKLKHRKNKYR